MPAAGISANISNLQSIAIITPSENVTSIKETVVSILASGTNATEINETKPSGCTVTKFSEEETGLFSIETSPDISDVTFALVSKYDSTIQTLNNKGLTIGGVNTATVSIEKPSNSIYDSKLHFEVTSNNGPFSSTTDEYSDVCYPTDESGTILNPGKWTATFADASNVNLIKSINTEHNVYNTTTNEYTRPLRVSNYDSFNQEYSLGLDLLNDTQHYFTEDNTTGKPILNSISEKYTLKKHDLVAEKVDDEFNDISLVDCGTYKIELKSDIPSIYFINEEADPKTSLSNFDGLPIFNSKSGQSLPGTINYSTFSSLFDLTTENIVPEYEFKVTIDEQSKSGYSPNSDMSHDSDSQNTFILNDNNLADNSVYMDKFVNGDHNVTLTNGTLVITAKTVSDKSDNIELFTLDGARETLSSDLFKNGEIKVNNRSVTERAAIIDAGLGLSASVYYADEDVNRDSITSVEQTNSYVNYNLTLIAKNSDKTPSYLKSNQCSLDLFNGDNIINDKFSSIKPNFSFDAASYSATSDIEVLKIKTNRKLSSINGFNSIAANNSLTSLDFFSTDVKVQNVSLLANDNVFNSAKILLELRNLSDLNIYKAVTDTNGWSITSIHDTKVASSSLSSQSGDENAWPSLDATISCIKGDMIDYNITFDTVSTGKLNMRLKDTITVNWSLRNTSTSSSFIIPQEMMSLIKNVSQDPDYTPVSPNEYSLTGDFQNKTHYVLKKAVSTRTIQYQFDPVMRVFIGLKMTTPEIQVKTTYYRLLDNNTGEYVSSKFLKFVKKTDTNVDYSEVTEVIDPNISNIEGTLTSSDFCDLTAHIEGKNMSTMSIVDLTTEYTVSSMFGIEHNMELIYENTNNIIGDVVFSMECDYLSSSGKEGYGILDNTDKGYQIQLTGSYDTEYIINNWSSKTASNFIVDTNIEDQKDAGTLSIATCYSGITKWSSDYSVDVSYSGANNSNMTLKIYKAADSLKTKVFSISTNNYTFITPNMFISCISNDIFSVVKTVGNSGTDCEISSPMYITVDYTYQKSPTTAKLFNIIKLDSGVYLSKTLLNNNIFGLSDITKSTQITLKGDLFGANLIDSVSQMNELKYVSTSNTGLVFQYNDTVNKHASQTLTITGGYRGYKGTQSSDQSYTLTRTKTTARFSIETATNGTVYQDFDVYYNSEYTVNSLTDGTDDNDAINVGSIGLKIKFLMSMDNNLESTSIPIYLLADNVTVSIANPNAIGYWNLGPEPSNLKDFTYTFSANIFTIAPKRIKMRTDDFEYGTVSWSVKLAAAEIQMYKNTNYLGNPENITVWTEIIDETQKYTFINLYDDKGIPITSKWVIKKNPDLTSNNTEAFIAYCVLIPTYTLFQQVYDQTLTIPYTFSTTQLTSKYVPFSNLAAINPFASVINANNITFTKTTSEKMSTILTNGSDTNFIVVEANKIKIQLFVNSITTPIQTLVDAMPINRLMYSITNNQSSLFMPTDGLSSTKSGITMKMSQPIITNTPYAPYLNSSSVLFSVSENINTNANISFKISNFFIPTGSFDLGLPCGSGTKVRLITRQIVNSGDTVEMIVYNYRGLNNYSTDNVDYDTNGSKSTILFFNDRSYKKKTISGSDFKTFLNSSKITKQDIIDGNVYDKFIADQANGFADGTAIDSNWTHDDSWPNTDNNDKMNLLYVSVTCFDDETTAVVPGKLFAATAAGKVALVSNFPIVDIRDKLGRPHVTITHDGTLKAPALSTSQVLLNKFNNTVNSADFSNIFGRQQAGYATSIQKPLGIA